MGYECCKDHLLEGMGLAPVRGVCRFLIKFHRTGVASVEAFLQSHKGQTVDWTWPGKIKAPHIWCVIFLAP